MKKVIVILCICFVLLLAIGAYAQIGDNGILEEIFNADSSQTAVTAEKQLSEDIEIFSRSEERQSIESFIDDAQSKAMDNIILSDDINTYLKFIKMYSIDVKELKEINKALKKGTTVDSVICAYKFWLTTDESIKIIPKMCALENKYYDEFWCEDAFNELINYSKGELSPTNVEEYVKRGLSINQIDIANILSRKYSATINDLLDEMLNGKQTSQLMNEVYNTDIFTDEYQDDELLVMLKSYFEIDVPYALSENAHEETNVADAIVKYKNNMYEKAEKAIEKYISKSDYSDISTYSEMQQPTVENEEEFNNMSLKNGMTQKCIRFLAKKGFTAEEIYQTSCNITDDENAFAAAKQIRGIK